MPETTCAATRVGLLSAGVAAARAAVRGCDWPVAAIRPAAWAAAL